jgi:hypothetical protein
VYWRAALAVVGLFRFDSDLPFRIEIWETYRSPIKATAIGPSMPQLVCQWRMGMKWVSVYDRVELVGTDGAYRDGHEISPVTGT